MINKLVQYKPVKFFICSSIASCIDLFLYFILLVFFSPFICQFFSYSMGMISNFTMQSLFVFSRMNNLQKTIFHVLPFLLIGLLLSTLLVYLITLNGLFYNNQIIVKTLVMSFTFTYNYFTRKYSFEGN